MEFKVFTDEGYIVNGDVQYIKRHKLSHSGFCAQQETIQSPNIKFGTSGSRNCVVDGGVGIINRHVLIKPKLFIGLENKKNANILIENMVKLTRNEDLMIPKSEITEMSYKEFDLIVGLESFEDKNGFLAGFNRFKKFGPMNFEPMLVNVNCVIE